jgi:hypothetical protein
MESPRTNWWTRRRIKRQTEGAADRAARRTATATVWLAVFTVILAFVGMGTFWLLWNQLREMHEGGIDTHALATATERAEKAARASAQASSDFADSASSINAEIGTAESDFSKMAGNSAAAIKVTQEAMRQDQRAWVGLLQVTGVPEVGKPYEVESILTNTGRTPAKNLVRLQSTSILPRGASFVPVYDASKPDSVNPSVSILFPNQFYRGTTKITNGKNLEQIDVDRITQGDLTVYVYGKVCYKDVFNKKHWERFCDLYSPSSKTYSSCYEYNEIDSNDSGLAESCELQPQVSNPN